MCLGLRWQTPSMTISASHKPKHNVQTPKRNAQTACKPLNIGNFNDMAFGQLEQSVLVILKFTTNKFTYMNHSTTMTGKDESEA